MGSKTAAHVEFIHMPKKDAEYWNGLMAKDHVDYGINGLSKESTAFLKTVNFGNGVLADLMVATPGWHEDVWCQVVAYDEHGIELWCSEVRDNLLGTWTFSLKHTTAGVVSYELVVVKDEEKYEDSVFGELKTTRDEFCGCAS